MTIGWPALGLLLLLLPLCCTASRRQQRGLHFERSLRFTLRIRAQVRHLLPQYKELQFGDGNYEDRTLVLQSLPAIDMEYSHWRSLQDWERLSTAAKALHTFSVHLDLVKRQTEEVKRPKTGRQVPNLTRTTFRIQRDLEDLTGQVKSQLERMNSTVLSHASTRPAPSAQPRPTSPRPNQDQWSSARQGYVILRDLERYLGRLARDFIVLCTRHAG